jgi:hypothetical protein
MIRLGLAAWLALCGVANAQLNGGGTGFPGPGMPAATGCSEATTFLARTTGLDATHTTAYTTLICGLVTDGVWAKIDLLAVYATQDSTTAVLNLKSTSFSTTVVGSPTFTADRGYTSSGTTNYLNTTFTPSTAGGNFTQNSAHISAWNITTGAGSTDRLIGNALSTTIRTVIRPRNASDQTGLDLNNNTEDLVANTSKDGWFVGNRSASNANQIYRNGSSLGSSATASTGISDQAIVLGTDATGGNSCTGCQIAAASAGSSLSAGDVTNFYNRLRTYMTAVGVP